jgi:hypothetical protein
VTNRRRAALLAYRALGLGDLLTAVPALRALTETWGDHCRLLATTGGVAPLARHLGLFDAVVTTRAFEPLPLASLDVAVNLHGRGPQSHATLLPAAHRLIAFAHPEVPETEGMPEWRDHEHDVSRWCRLVAAAGARPDPARLDIAAPRCAVPAGAHGATIVHPGAASAARRWPVRRWAAVARGERAAGRTVMVTGSRSERPLALAVARAAGLEASSVAAGRTDVLQLSGLVAAAARVVCGDTGVAHLATALGTPSVVLFGPTSPAQWGPPRERAKHRVLWAGRTGDPHGARPDPGLLELGVEAVVDALSLLPVSDRAKESA